MRIKGIIYTVVSAILFGLSPILGSLSYRYGNDSYNLSFYRNLFAIPILILVLLFTQKRNFSLKNNRSKDLFFISLFGVSLTTFLLYDSYNYLGVGTTTTLHFMYPLFVTLVCLIFFHDKISKFQMACLLLAMLGVIFFIDVNSIRNIKGIFMAVFSGITYAFYMVSMEKKNLTKMNPVLNSLYIAFFGTLTFLVIGLITGKARFDIPPIALLLTAGVSLMTSFLAVILIQQGIRYIGSSLAAIFSLLEPITSLIAGYLFLNESLTFKNIIGSFIIFLAVLILIRHNFSEVKKVSDKSNR